MAYQINLTGQEIDERLQNVGTPEDAAAADGTLYARIKKNADDIDDHETKQTNIEEVVSGERTNVFFSLPQLLLNIRKPFVDFAGIYVTLYRWTGKRYHKFEIQRDTNGSFLEIAEDYKITLKTNGNDGFSKQLFITYADGTEEPLVSALKNEFEGRISYKRRKKRRWRLQAFKGEKPITAPFDFRVSIADNGDVFLTKGGMMRSVPNTDEVVYDGFFVSDDWLAVKKGDIINVNYNSSERRFPQAGDFIDEFKAGIVVASERYDSQGNYRILWTAGRVLYVIGIRNDIDESGEIVYRCVFPAKKLCDDIYVYASKMNSGTLRDLYISAGAKYNEATGFYELNGLTDITEEQMRVIYEKTWGWWIGLPNLSGFGDSSARTNIPCPDYKRTYYQSNVNLSSSFATTGNLDNLEVLNFIPTQYPKNFSIKLSMRAMNWMCQSNAKPLTIMGTFEVGGVPDNNSLNIGGNIKTINIKNLSKNIRFYGSKVLSKESVLYMINNSAATSAITIGLQQAVYDVMKDDADIIAALTEKTNITLIQNT